MACASATLDPAQPVGGRGRPPHRGARARQAAVLQRRHAPRGARAAQFRPRARRDDGPHAHCVRYPRGGAQCPSGGRAADGPRSRVRCPRGAQCPSGGRGLSTRAFPPALVFAGSGVRPRRTGLKAGGGGRIWQPCGRAMDAGRNVGGTMATGVNLSNLASAMDNADFVLIDGVVFAKEYIARPRRTHGRGRRRARSEARRHRDHVHVPGNGRRRASRRGRLSAEIGRGAALPVDRDDPLRRSGAHRGAASRADGPFVSAARDRRSRRARPARARWPARAPSSAAATVPLGEPARTRSPARRRRQCRSAW